MYGAGERMTGGMGRVSERCSLPMEYCRTRGARLDASREDGDVS